MSDVYKYLQNVIVTVFDFILMYFCTQAYIVFEILMKLDGRGVISYNKELMINT